MHGCPALLKWEGMGLYCDITVVNFQKWHFLTVMVLLVHIPGSCTMVESSFVSR